MLMGGGIGSLLLGWLMKKWPSLPNGLIPLLNGAVFSLLYATIGKMGFSYDTLITGMAAAYAATAVYELTTVGKPKAVAMIAGLMLALATPALGQGVTEEKVSHKAFDPFWSGTVYGTFFNGAGADSLEGPRAKIQVPVAVALTNPIERWGWRFTPYAHFKWTTKAYIGEESEPLDDASYNWWPHVRIEPTNPGLLRWVKVGPEHESNGEVDPASRSVDGLSAEVALQHEVAGILLDVYVKAWGIYRYGENTWTINDAINFGGALEDAGGKVVVRGRVDVLQLATELGPEWQKYMAFIPLPEFYHLGIYGEFHNGKAEGLLDYDEDVESFGVGIAMAPR